MINLSKTLVILGLGLNLEASAVSSRISLPFDIIGAANVVGDDKTPSRLAVFDSDGARPKSRRHLNWLTKTRGEQERPVYRNAQRQLVPDRAASFDICALDPNSPVESVLYLDANGILKTDGERLVRTSSLLAHARDDALPKVRVCFNLFPGEPPALVIPLLDSLEIWRATAPQRYVRHASLPLSAGLRFFGPPVRASDSLAVQRLSLRLELPDVIAADYNGDDKFDLCLCREDQVTCYLQNATGFSPKEQASQFFGVLTEAEEKDTSLKVDCRLVELTGDRRVDVILQKSQYNLSDMRTTLLIHPQMASGGFTAKAAQTIERTGYFAYQEFLDLDDDGQTDIVAPVASLSWTELASIYLSRKADIEFVYYRNLGQGRFDPQPRSLHSLSFPIDPKNWNAILGVLPIWQARLQKPETKTRQVVFFPERAAVELYTLKAGSLRDEPVWKQKAELGSDILTTDLDRDGYDELIFAYPRDADRAKQLLFIEMDRPHANNPAGP